MAVKGTETKEAITKKILEVFPGSFVNGKEIRICATEDGEDVQIKVTLTAAKDLVDAPAGTTQISTQPASAPTELAVDEKEDVRRLLKELGL